MATVRVRTRELGERYPHYQGVTPVTAQWPVVASCVDGYLFYAERDYRIMRVDAAWHVAGGSGATLDLNECAEGDAPADGDTLVSLDLTGAIDTVHTDETLPLLSAGKYLAADFSGTLGSIEGLGVSLLLMPVKDVMRYLMRY